MLTVDREDEHSEPRPAPPALGSIGSLRMSDIGRGLARYKVIALTVVAIVLAAMILPGPKVVGDTRREVAQSQGTAATSDVADTVTTEPAPGTFDAVLAPSSVLVDDMPARANTFSVADTLDSDTTDSGSDTDADGSSSASGSSSSSASSTSTVIAKTPLRIRVAAWSTRTAGTPLAAQNVPEKTLPVGKRLGQDDKISFVKLSGTETVLKLKVGDAAGQRAADTAAIMACPILGSAWTEAEALSTDADPEYDCAKGVEGKASAGTWTFDLASFGAPAISGDRGFALVPMGDTLADFQVAFARG